MSIISLTSNAWALGHTSGAKPEPTLTYVSNMVSAWEMFRPSGVIQYKPPIVAQAKAGALKSLVKDSTNETIWMSTKYGEITEVANEKSYLEHTAASNSVVLPTLSGGSYAAGVPIFSGFDTDNYLDSQNTITSPASFPKTHTVLMEFTEIPTAGQFSHFMGTSTRGGSAGWRIWLGDNGFLNWQYNQYDNVNNTEVTYQVNNFFQVALNTKYLITVIAQPGGQNSVYISTVGSNNTTPILNQTITSIGFKTFAPILLYTGASSGDIEYGLGAKWFGFWTWDQALNTSQISQNYTELTNHGVFT